MKQKNESVCIWDMDDLDKLCNQIDWLEYKSCLESSLANEKIWEFGCFDDYNPHTHNIMQIEKELSLIESAEFEAVLKMHDVEYFKDFKEERI